MQVKYFCRDNDGPIKLALLLDFLHCIKNLRNAALKYEVAKTHFLEKNRHNCLSWYTVKSIIMIPHFEVTEFLMANCSTHSICKCHLWKIYFHNASFDTFLALEQKLVKYSSHNQSLKFLVNTSFAVIFCQNWVEARYSRRFMLRSCDFD